MKDVGLLLGRIVIGALVAGHGAQKLFGWFEGPGFRQWIAGTESRMGMRPGHFWGTAQAGAEFGGGALTALGFLNPLGPLGVIGSMAAAVYKGHWGKPIWAAKGGPELAVSFMASGVMLALTGPGRLSLDALFGIRLPRWVTALSILAGAGLLAEMARPTVTPKFFPGDTPPASQQ